jgi:hypothetical protein
VFDTGLGSAKDIIRLMENALDQPKLPEGYTPRIVAEIKAALARIVSAGL